MGIYSIWKGPRSSYVEFDYTWQVHKHSQNCASHLEENINQVSLERSSSQNICNKSSHFLTQVYFYNTEKPKQHSSLLVSCCKREVFSLGATSKQNLSRMCIHCNAKQTPNASTSLKALLSITMSRALRADRPLEGESGTCGEVPDGLKRPLGTLNIK